MTILPTQGHHTGLHYVEVYSVCNTSAFSLGFLIMPLVLAVVFLLPVYVPAVRRNYRGWDHDSTDQRASKGARRWHQFLGCFALAFWLATNAVMYFEHLSYCEALRSGRCSVVEGAISDYHPGDASKREPERFTVGSAHFEYVDYVITGTYNKTASSGGVIRPNQLVRIAYIDGKILRLEIAEPPK